MHKITLLSLLSLLLPTTVTAQIFYDRGALITMRPGAEMIVNGGMSLKQQSELINDGFLQVASNVAIGYFRIDDQSIVRGAGDYKIQGDWINNATFLPETSDVEMYANAFQQITSTNNTATTFYNLKLTGTGTGLNKMKRLHKVGATVTNELNLTNRELNTDTNKVFVTNTSINAILNDITPANEGFVSSIGKGALSWKTIAGVYIFPTGSGLNTARYRPARITPAQSGSTYELKLTNADPSFDTYDKNAIDSLICYVNNSFYHSIHQSVGTSPTNIALTYNPTTDGNYDRNAQWNTPQAAKWNNMGAANTVSIQGLSAVENISWQDFSNKPFILARNRPQGPTILGNNTVCSNGLTTFTINPSNPGSTYSWTTPTGSTIATGQGTDKIEVRWNQFSSGEVSVIESNPTFGCATLPFIFPIAIFPTPTAAFTTVTSGYYNNTFQFNDQTAIAVPSTITDWNWTVGDADNTFYTNQNPSHTYTEFTDFQVRLIVTSSDGCLDTVTQTVSIANDKDLFIPTGFSPNADGVNDNMVIKGLEFYPQSELMIFNRWGDLVYQKTNYDNTWNGTTNVKGLHIGDVLPDGTYFYVFKKSANETLQNGSIELKTNK